MQGNINNYFVFVQASINKIIFSFISEVLLRLRFVGFLLTDIIKTKAKVANRIKYFGSLCRKLCKLFFCCFLGYNEKLE